MHFLLILLSLFSIFSSLLCAPVQDKPNSEIVEYEFKTFEEGGYVFSYKTSDQQTRWESAFFKTIDGVPVFTVEGTYSYIGDDGKEVKVKYVSDENGFVLKDPDAPQPPAHLPPNIIASLAG